MLRIGGIHPILLSRHIMSLSLSLLSLLLLLLLLLLLQSVITLAQQVATDTEAMATPDRQKSDRVAIMDTMFWVGNTEFGEQDNWRKRVKPCTLLERIRINEQSVISLGDSMDALGGSLESNIKDLVMPLNGMLLLEEDNISDPLDPLFIQYLNQSGDCFDSSVYSEQGDSAFLFEFELDSDQFSWFNPDNWRSSLMGSQENSVRLYPESHMIPCNHDAVVFGSRRMALKTTTEDNERSQTLTFKVNFRPSLAMIEELNFNATAIAEFGFNQLRVFSVEIGNQSYNQQEFEQLINSDQYENILFQFNDTFSLLREENGFAYSWTGSSLTIDESTATSGQYYEMCQDEAGCICGNENTNVMKAICSFRNPIAPDQLPCYDPVSSTGYCNKICATVLTIFMDPTKFKEAFLFRVLTKAAKSISQFRDDPSDGSIVNLRRTSENRYEITVSIQLITTDEYVDYQFNSDLERQFAQNIFDQLDNAKRSFYGIKSISLKTSVQWKTNNHSFIFVTSFVLMFTGLLVNFVREEVAKDETSRLMSTSEITSDENYYTILFRDWLIAPIRRVFTQAPVQADEDPSFIRHPELVDCDDGFANENALDGSMSEIPLLNL